MTEHAPTMHRRGDNTVWATRVTDYPGVVRNVNCRSLSFTLTLTLTKLGWLPRRTRVPRSPMACLGPVDHTVRIPRIDGTDGCSALDLQEEA